MENHAEANLFQLDCICTADGWFLRLSISLWIAASPLLSSSIILFCSIHFCDSLLFSVLSAPSSVLSPLSNPFDFSHPNVPSCSQITISPQSICYKVPWKEPQTRRRPDEVSKKGHIKYINLHLLLFYGIIGMIQQKNPTNNHSLKWSTTSMWLGPASSKARKVKTGCRLLSMEQFLKGYACVCSAHCVCV